MWLWRIGQSRLSKQFLRVSPHRQPAPPANGRGLGLARPAGTAASLRAEPRHGDGHAASSGVITPLPPLRIKRQVPASVSGNSPSAPGASTSTCSYAPIRIIVAGTDAFNSQFVEETTTTYVNRFRAHFSLSCPLNPDDYVWVKNLRNDIEEEFRVLGPWGSAMGLRCEWVFQATQPHSKIWKEILAPSPEEPGTPISITCEACYTAEEATLSQPELGTLVSSGSSYRFCTRCGETTLWKTASHHGTYSEYSLAGVER